MRDEMTSDRTDTSIGDRWTAADTAWCAAFFLLALIVRLVGTHLFEGLSAPPNGTAFYDGVEFEQLARSLVEHGRYAIGNGAPTSFRAPGLPFLVAGVYAVAGSGNYLAAHVALCVIGALVVLPTYILGRGLAGRMAAMSSAALVAVIPNIAYYSIHFSSEPLYTLALLSSLAMLVSSMLRERSCLTMLSGILLGVAALARPVGVYFVPFFAAALWVAFPHRQAARAVLLFTAGTAIAVVPWTVRNYLVHDRLLLIASNGGSTFWGSNNSVIAHDPRLRGEWISTRILRGRDSPIDRVPNEVDRDRLEFEEGKRWVKSHFGEATTLLWWKTFKLWTPFPTTPNRAFRLGSALGFLLFAPFVIPGAFQLARAQGPARRLFLVTTAPVVGTAAAALVFYGSIRFRSPIEPILIIWACTWFASVARRRWAPVLGSRPHLCVGGR
jgi:4-amino-4-deoxy-L-arabinose transferase-like glycosyltransferase